MQGECGPRYRTQKLQSQRQNVVECSALWRLRLLLLSKSPHSSPCEARRQLCKDILEKEPGTLEMNSARLLAFARPTLEHCAATGTLPRQVYDVFHELGKAWQADTEFMESLNKVVKQETGNALAISQPLLSARVVNRYVLDQIAHATGARKSSALKWSAMEDEFWRLCESTTSAVAGAGPFVAQPSRVQPQPANQIISNDHHMTDQP